jgi:hypothetical protein
MTNAALDHRGPAGKYGARSRRQHGHPKLLVAAQRTVVCQEYAPANPSPPTQSEVSANNATAQEMDGLLRCEHAGLLENKPFELTGVPRGKEHRTSMPSFGRPNATLWITAGRDGAHVCSRSECVAGDTACP